MMPAKGMDPKKAREMAAAFSKRQEEMRNLPPATGAAQPAMAQQSKKSMMEAAKMEAAKSAASNASRAKPMGGVIGAAINPVAEAAKAAAAKAAAGNLQRPTSMPFGSTVGARPAAPSAPNVPGAFGSRKGPSSGFGGIPLQQPSEAAGPTTPPGAFGVRNVPGRNTSGGFKKGGKVKAKSSYSSGGKIGSASKRADGIAQRGKTKGKVI